MVTRPGVKAPGLFVWVLLHWRQQCCTMLAMSRDYATESAECLDPRLLAAGLAELEERAVAGVLVPGDLAEVLRCQEAVGDS